MEEQKHDHFLMQRYYISLKRKRFREIIFKKLIITHH